jgi:DNA-binding MarR family transcriptional regulator
MSAPEAIAPANAAADWQLEFIERVGRIADVSQLPPSFGRVFAWLVVCDPPYQSVDQMREVLGLSAGTISMATATLVRMGLVERFTQPGRRRLSYRLQPGGWEKLMRLRIDAAAQMRQVAEHAIAGAPNPPGRLAEMRDVYAWFEQNIADLIARAPWATDT